jgi:hypothetical protein
MPSTRTATKARAISRNRSIIGCPLTGNSLGRRLTVNGVDNKANGRFCRLAGVRHQPRGYSLLQSALLSGGHPVRAKSASPLTRAPRSAHPNLVIAPRLRPLAEGPNVPYLPRPRTEQGRVDIQRDVKIGTAMPPYHLAPLSWILHRRLRNVIAAWCSLRIAHRGRRC